MADAYDNLFGAWHFGSDGRTHHYLRGKPLCRKAVGPPLSRKVPRTECNTINPRTHCRHCLVCVDIFWATMYPPQSA